MNLSKNCVVTDIFTRNYPDKIMDRSKGDVAIDSITTTRGRCWDDVC